MNPFFHYLKYGANENRNPSSFFDTKFYKESNLDLSESKLNPLIHYLLHGINEGRKPLADPDSSEIDINDFLFENNSSYPIEKYFNTIIKSKLSIPKNNPNKRHIVIIAELSLPQCTKYRVRQMQEMLIDNNFSVEISSWSDTYRSLNALQKAATVIFYRVPANDIYANYIYECKRLKITIGYDIDDPIFDRNSILDNENIKYINANSVRNFLNDSNKFLIAINLSSFCIVSTPKMKKLLKINGYTGKIIIRRNAVDTNSFYLSNDIIRKENNNKKVKIIYATPSLAHTADFYSIQDPLYKIMRKYEGRVELYIMGDIVLPKKLMLFNKSIKQLPPVDYDTFLTKLHKMDINIVPLLSNTFNETKSNIKFIDASLVEVTSICSYIGDYADSLSHGEYCFLPKNDDEWFKYMSILIDNTSLRKNMARKSRIHTITEFSSEKTSHQFIKGLLEIK